MMNLPDLYRADVHGFGVASKMTSLRRAIKEAHSLLPEKTTNPIYNDLKEILQFLYDATGNNLPPAQEQSNAVKNLFLSPEAQGQLRALAKEMACYKKEKSRLIARLLPEIADRLQELQRALSDKDYPQLWENFSAIEQDAARGLSFSERAAEGKTIASSRHAL